MERLQELVILEGQLNEKRHEVLMEQMKGIVETQKTILLVLSTMVKEPQIKNAIRRIVDYDPIREVAKVLDSTASDKITIYCHNKQEFLDFTDWMLGVFREYGTILMADILDKIGFSDAQVDHDLEITESQVFMYDEKQKVVIYKND